MAPWRSHLFASDGDLRFLARNRRQNYHMKAIEISLAPWSENDFGNNQDCLEYVTSEYTKSFLESLGINRPSSPRNRKLHRLVENKFPLRQCRIEAVWNDHGPASVAERLVIRQPISQKPSPSGPLTASPGSQTEDDACLPNRFADKPTYLQVDPPTIPEIYRPAPLFIVGDGRQTEEAAKNLQAWASKGWAPHLSPSQALAQELADFRRSRTRRPCWEEEAEVTTYEIWEAEREKLEAELKNLQRKYILPFTYRGELESAEGKMVTPWQISELGPPLDVPESLRSAASAPISATLEEIRADIQKYAKECFPIKLLTSREDPQLLSTVRNEVACMEIVRLIGLIAHLLYWHILGPLHRPESRLSETQRQSLEVTIHNLWTTVTSRHKNSPVGAGFILPALMIAVKCGIEGLFKASYPSVFETSAVTPLRCFPRQILGTQLVQQINIICRDFLDPDCTRARFSFLDGLAEANELWHKLNIALASRSLGSAARLVAKIHRTTPLVQRMLRPSSANLGGIQERRGDEHYDDQESTDHYPGPADARTRRLLARCASAPSVRGKRVTTSGFEERRRTALLRTATRNIAADVFRSERGGQRRAGSGGPAKRSRGSKPDDSSASRNRSRKLPQNSAEVRQQLSVQTNSSSCGQCPDAGSNDAGPGFKQTKQTNKPACGHEGRDDTCPELAGSPEDSRSISAPKLAVEAFGSNIYPWTTSGIWRKEALPRLPHPSKKGCSHQGRPPSAPISRITRPCSAMQRVNA